MTTLSFTNNNGCFCYTISVNQLNVRVCISDPRAGDISDFEKVSTGNGKIIFCDSNGQVDIIANKRGVSFSVGKFGAGGDGVIDITLPFDACCDALVQSLEARRLIDQGSESDQEEIPVKYLKPIRFCKNSHGNLEYSEWPLVCDIKSKQIVGTQNANGNVDPLTEVDIAICNKYKMSFVL